MKFTAGRGAFSAALSHSSRIIERRNTIPILGNVLLTTKKDNSVELRSTDLDLELTLSFEANVIEPGTTSVQAGLLNDIVRKMSDKTEVTFQLDGGEGLATVSAGRSKFKLQSLPAVDFPDLTVGTFTHSFQIDPAKLKWMLSRTQFAISTEETRYYLNGIFFHSIESDGGLKLRAVATDGHRLARADIEAPAGAAGMPGIIIPRKTVSELDKLLTGAKEVSVSVNSSKIKFVVDGMAMVSKLIDGTFPDYQRVIPQLSNMVAIANTKELAQASDRVSTVSSERGRAVRMSFGDNKLKMVVSNPDSGSAEEYVDLDYEAAEIEIGFNAKYLQDIMGVVSTEKMRLYLTDPGSPALLMSDGDEGAIFVLMPMRV